MLAKSLLLISPFVAASGALAFFFTANHAHMQYGTGAANKIKARYDRFQRTAYDSREGQRWMK